MSDGPGLVMPRWGTRRRTRDEWLAAGGDEKVGKPDDPLWPTLGHQPGMVSRRLRLPPMPHQQHIFDVAFELDPGKPGDLWYTEADVWVMRQCGKTMGILFPVITHRLTMFPRLMGGRQRAAFTMQDRQETRTKLEVDFIPQLVEASDSFRRITNPKGRPGRSTAEWKSSLNNGSEHLLFGQGNYMHIATPTSKKAGHGGTLDLKASDELRFGIDDRGEASSGPAQITRRSRQRWNASTAGDEDSFFMWPKVVADRARIERKDTETRVCSFEWAIPEGADLHDREVWYAHHPAAGHTIQVSDIIDELRKAEDSPDETKIDTFRQEYGNQWVRHPIIGTAKREYVIDLAIWGKRAVSLASTFLRPRTLGVSVADDGRSAAIVVAAWNPHGQAQVKVLDLKPGTFWIEAALAKYRDDWKPAAITYDAGGPTNAIEGPIARGAGRVDVEPITGRSYSSACKAFLTGFEEGRYRHVDQQWLNDAVEGAKKKQRGDAWLWDLQSSLADITPLVAATCALRSLEGRPPERRSAYEDEGLTTVGGQS
jgi:hypothetical protein